MKNRIFFGMIIGIAIATAAGTESDNIVACLFVGAGSSTLLMIVTNLEVDKKIRN